MQHLLKTFLKDLLASHPLLPHLLKAKKFRFKISEDGLHFFDPKYKVKKSITHTQFEKFYHCVAKDPSLKRVSSFYLYEEVPTLQLPPPIQLLLQTMLRSPLNILVVARDEKSKNIAIHLIEKHCQDLVLIVRKSFTHEDHFKGDFELLDSEPWLNHLSHEIDHFGQFQRLIDLNQVAYHEALWQFLSKRIVPTLIFVQNDSHLSALRYISQQSDFLSQSVGIDLLWLQQDEQLPALMEVTSHACMELNQGGELKITGEIWLKSFEYYQKPSFVIDFQNESNLLEQSQLLDAINEPVINEPVINEPVINEPVINDPIINNPIINEPIINEPVINNIKENIIIDLNEDSLIKSEITGTLNAKILEEAFDEAEITDFHEDDDDDDDITKRRNTILDMNFSELQSKLSEDETSVIQGYEPFDLDENELTSPLTVDQKSNLSQNLMHPQTPTIKVTAQRDIFQPLQTSSLDRFQPDDIDEESTKIKDNDQSSLNTISQNTISQNTINQNTINQSTINQANYQMPLQPQGMKPLSPPTRPMPIKADLIKTQIPTPIQQNINHDDFNDFDDFDEKTDYQAPPTPQIPLHKPISHSSNPIQLKPIHSSNAQSFYPLSNVPTQPQYASAQQYPSQPNTQPPSPIPSSTIPPSTIPPSTVQAQSFVQSVNQATTPQDSFPKRRSFSDLLKNLNKSSD